MSHILLICTGNTCRSPMAEGMLKKLVQQHAMNIEVRSAGIFAYDHSPISQHAQKILDEKNIHDVIVSKSLKKEDIHWSNYIFTMTVQHKRWIIEHFPEALERTFTLKEFTEDCLDTKHLIAQINELILEQQLKKSLSGQIDTEIHKKTYELSSLIPSSDITDPYGGTLEDYRKTANEIEKSLQIIVTKLK
jgi:protein-tyrosine-phosphatase